MKITSNEEGGMNFVPREDITPEEFERLIYHLELYVRMTKKKHVSEWAEKERRENMGENLPYIN